MIKFAISFLTILSVVNSQRFTHPLFGSQNGYEVNEGPKSIFQSGNNLRFGLNPKLGDPIGFLNGNHFKPSLFSNQQQSNSNQQSNFYPKFNSFGSLGGFGNFHQNQNQNGQSNQNFGGYYHPYGYNQNQKDFYNDENKKLADSGYKQQRGHQGHEGEAGVKKINEGVEEKKQGEEQSGLYANEEANKKIVEDSKKFDGQKLNSKEGSNENEQKNKSSHKKGHVVKHFKNSHHKDETGRDEQYYDEEHDEGGAYKYDSSKGKFGENESTQHKEVQENKESESSEKAQKGGHENSQFAGQNSGVAETFKEEKKVADASEHGQGNHREEESILGHQEAEKSLLKQPLHDGFDKDT